MKQCMDAENLHRRLKKIIGQVQAIDRMVDEDVPCEDVLSQISAAKSALNGCGKVVQALRQGRHRARRRGKDDRGLHQSRRTLCEYAVISENQPF